MMFASRDAGERSGAMYPRLYLTAICDGTRSAFVGGAVMAALGGGFSSA